MAVRLPNIDTIYLPELLKLVNNEPDKLSQRDYLYQYYNKGQMYENILKAFIELMVHPEVQWQIPIGIPPFEPASVHIDQAPSSLFLSFRECSRFLKGGQGFVEDKDKRELQFIIILESLSKDEAELLCQIKDKNLISYPNVDMRVFVEAFPEYLPEEVVSDFLEGKYQDTSPKTSTTALNESSKGRGRPKKVI